MKRIVMSCAGMLAGVAILAMPQSADACSECDPDRPRCRETINRRCNASAKQLWCEEWVTSCAYAYAPAEISADGSVASLAASPSLDHRYAEQARGCHGLIVDRAYSPNRQAQAHTASKRIVL